MYYLILKTISFKMRSIAAEMIKTSIITLWIFKNKAKFIIISKCVSQAIAHKTKRNLLKISIKDLLWKKRLIITKLIMEINSKRIKKTIV